MNGGLISIQEAVTSLKPSERKAAEYIINFPEEVINLSIQKLSQRAEVSEATIIRLARTLNYKGFQELKLRIAGDLATKSSSFNQSYQEISIDGSVDSFISNVSNNNIQSIHDTISVLSKEEVEKAINALQEARKVALYGIGASGLIARDFKQKLSRINRWCEAAVDYDTQGTISANLGESDVVFGISYSGQTIDIIQSLKVAKDNGAKVITLTKYGLNPVSELADIKLYTSSLEKSIRSGAMSSRISQLNVIDILYVGMTSRNYEESVAALERTRKAVDVKKHV
ncbi:MurR/RpiR family transcriptional regulator [Halobacillus mangrovi]|uniref:MurR/RpiR family transcriptional regulator n=1 Tax=Halobacillus mangrovi TaxID=402384 RepID=UPI003D98C4D9